ncbi:GNAT family N-acetyltransferase [Oceanobacillus neutriphilus]|uniref:Acetyltransferase n=1 Tax=Oceanobacillus neutriphilus TaxID=531815 RepID=A0ABQ2P373_9BACI|nr:GNAT family N-acetyltransferase [Oceanobacillus neutriphilus]GGP17007.1 acetyltransferase [Oceanobacillus neutriphilus]
MQIFRELKSEDEAAFFRYINQWYLQEEAVIPTATEIKRYKNYQQFIKYLSSSKQADFNPGFVPNSTFFLFIGDEIVGASNIRHELNEGLKEVGGHIGYGVAPNERNKGYATTILEHSLAYLKKMQVHEALITCNQKNHFSAKVIIKCGGGEIALYKNEEGGITRRFWISLI